MYLRLIPLLKKIIKMIDFFMFDKAFNKMFDFLLMYNTMLINCSLHSVTIFFFLIFIMLSIYVYAYQNTLTVNKQYLLLYELNENIYKADHDFNALNKCVQLIEKYPEMINIKSHSDGYTAFLRACYGGCEELISYMIEMGADLHSTSVEGDSPIMMNVYHLVNKPQKYNVRGLHRLFYAGCDINAKKYGKYSALHLAAKYGHTSLVRWLIAHGAQISSIKPTPKEIALKNGHYRTAEVIEQYQALERKIDVFETNSIKTCSTYP